MRAFRVMVRVVSRVMLALALAVMAQLVVVPTTSPAAEKEPPIDALLELVQAPTGPQAPPPQLPPEKPPLALQLNFQERNYFDSWDNDLIAQCLSSRGRFVTCSSIGRPERNNHESGTQFTTKLDAFAKLKDFELTVRSGYIDTEYTRSRAETVLSDGTIQTNLRDQGSATIDGFTDTEVNLVYNNFDHKTHGIEIGGRVNLATGITRLTDKQLRAVPSEDIVTTAATGEGFNAGPILKLWKQSGEHSWFLGGRLIYLGEYDLTKEHANDTVGGGYEAAGEIGFNHPRGSAGYTLISLNRAGDEIQVYANLLYASIMSKFEDTGVFWRLNGTTGYNIVDVGENSLANRRAQYQDGFVGSLDAELGYRWLGASLSLVTGVKGSVNRDVENQFVNPTSRKLYIGTAATYDLLRTRSGTLSLYAEVKYDDVISSPADTVRGGLERGGREDIDYDVIHGFVGFSYSFTKLF